MSYPEHLIENALTALEEDDREKFYGDKHNILMAETAKITLDAVWEMANYVLYTWYPYKEFIDGK